MKWPWYLALLLILVANGLTLREEIVAQWAAVYPSDPDREMALHLCFMEYPPFNRLSARERVSCYERWLPVVAAR
jgi:hypothetical protein